MFFNPVPQFIIKIQENFGLVVPTSGNKVNEKDWKNSAKCCITADFPKKVQSHSYPNKDKCAWVMVHFCRGMFKSIIYSLHEGRWNIDMTSSHSIENTPLFKNSQGIFAIHNTRLFMYFQTPPSWRFISCYPSCTVFFSASETYTVHQPSISMLPATSGLQKHHAADKQGKFKCGWTGM